VLSIRRGFVIEPGAGQLFFSRTCELTTTYRMSGAGLREPLSFGTLGRSGDGGKAMSGSTDKGKESELIAAILAGNTELYHQLIRPYERRVYIMALSYMKNREDAEDVAQETFVRAIQNLRTFRGDSQFSTWLIGIALNEARHRLRRRAAIQNVPFDESPDESIPASAARLRDWRELPSEAVEREEIRKLIEHAVTMLPDIYQQVFMLRDVEELNVNDTAIILDISTSLVKVRSHRARMMLQRLLAPQLAQHRNCLEEETASLH
jgi:RNA polymerase sigma-70 factor, ECF subfamily